MKRVMLSAKTKPIELPHRKVMSIIVAAKFYRYSSKNIKSKIVVSKMLSKE